MTVRDEAFWDGLKPLAFGGIPQLQVSSKPFFCGPQLGRG